MQILRGLTIRSTQRTLALNWWFADRTNLHKDYLQSLSLCSILVSFKCFSGMSDDFLNGSNMYHAIQNAFLMSVLRL